MSNERIQEILENMRQHVFYTDRWEEVEELVAEIRRLRKWVDELTGGIHWDED